MQDKVVKITECKITGSLAHGSLAHRMLGLFSNLNAFGRLLIGLTLGAMPKSKETRARHPSVIFTTLSCIAIDRPKKNRRKYSRRRGYETKMGMTQVSQWCQSSDRKSLSRLNLIRVSQIGDSEDSPCFDLRLAEPRHQRTQAEGTCFGAAQQFADGTLLRKAPRNPRETSCHYLAFTSPSVAL